MPSDLAFRTLLLDLDDEMSDEERKRFVFLIGDDIPKRSRAEPLAEVFTILIDRGRISETDCSYLEMILDRMKLTKSAYKIARYSAGHCASVPVQPVLTTLSPLDNLSIPEVSNRAAPSSSSLAAQEFLREANEPDAMILPGPSLVGKPAPPEPVEIPLHVENTDLKTFESGVWSEEFCQKMNIYLRPYEYQRELVQTAIQAGNTIICLRTGAGKTLVVALLLKYYLMKKIATSDGEPKKFLSFVFVPRRAILKQQQEKLAQVGNLRIAVCDETNDVTQYINHHEVILCTPQKFLNGLKAQSISLSTIDLLCFDECHDTVAYQQFVGIMQYLMCPGIGSIPTTDALPMVIGLTATIGLHGSNSGLVTNKLAELCATFHCSTITTVLKAENTEELNRFINHHSAGEICSVERDKQFDTLTFSLEKDLQTFILQLFSNRDTNPSRIFPEKDLEDNGYGQELELLKQSAQKKQDFSTVLLYTSILAIYQHSKAFGDLTPELVLSNLRDHFKTVYESREHPMEIDTLIYDRCQQFIQEKLKRFEQSLTVLSNPKLAKLIELLKQHAEKPNSRALVLVERTFYTEKIGEFLQNHRDLKEIIRPCWLVSQNSLDGRKSNKKEESVLSDFRTGACNIMISTDVIHTGSDIPECSLVVRYEFVPDSIGTVQARLRARVTDCRYYLVTSKGSSNYHKELDNRQHEHEMEEALEAWKRTSPDLFTERVIDQRNRLQHQWKESLTRLWITQSTAHQEVVLTGEILCRSCGYLLGSLDRLRRFGPSYFVHADDFYNRIEEKKHAEPEEFQRTKVTGAAFCGNKSCRAKLGHIEVLKDYPKLRPIYPLRCKSVKIKQTNADRGEETILLKSQWKQMPFTVPFFDHQASQTEDVFYDAWDSFPSNEQ